MSPEPVFSARRAEQLAEGAQVIVYPGATVADGVRVTVRKV